MPVFFVLMGMRVDLKSLASPAVLGFGALITVAAILGKQVCGLGVLERGVNRIPIGVGMIPRGEVGLLFAGLGSRRVVYEKPIFSQTIFAALVLMLSTMATPPFAAGGFEDLYFRTSLAAACATSLSASSLKRKWSATDFAAAAFTSATY